MFSLLLKDSNIGYSVSDKIHLAAVLTGEYCACTGEEALHEYLRTKAITVEY